MSEHASQVEINSMRYQSAIDAMRRGPVCECPVCKVIQRQLGASGDGRAPVDKNLCGRCGLDMFDGCTCLEESARATVAELL